MNEYRTHYIEDIAIQRVTDKLLRIHDSMLFAASQQRHRKEPEKEINATIEAAWLVDSLRKEVRLEWRAKQDSWI